MDVTNPGVVSVASEVYGNPDPNGGQAKWAPRELDVLIPVAADGRPLPPDGGVDASVFSTPKSVKVDTLQGFPATLANFPQIPRQVFVDNQSIGQGSMQEVTPGNPANGFGFVSPADFIVVGSSESFQTNSVDEIISFTIASVLDADNLPHAATSTTTRYYIVITTPPTLTSYPVSMLGRQVTLTSGNYAGANRIIQNYGTNFITLATQDQSVSNGDKVDINTAIGGVLVPGTTFNLAVNRQGSEQVNTAGGSVDVFILPPPQVNVPFPGQADQSQGNVFVSTGSQPGSPIIGSGVQIPNNTRNVSVPDECSVVGLPANVFV